MSWRLLDGTPDVGYIRIERFSGLTDKELEQGLAGLKDAVAPAALADLVLDLRGNPGGLLDAAVDVSSHFLDGGPVLSERQSDGGEQVYEASQGGDALDSRLMILVDQGTASAAEIVAGALSDRQRATLVGVKTYGKGSVQRIHRLSDNSAIHVTFARWYTPNGRQLDGQGLTPDVEVPFDEQAHANGQDPMLETALNLLRTP